MPFRSIEYLPAHSFHLFLFLMKESHQMRSAKGLSFSTRSYHYTRTGNTWFFRKLNSSICIHHETTPIFTNIVLISATKKADRTPNKITEPASLNILPPTPSTYPSDLCSIAAEMTAVTKSSNRNR